MPLTESKPRAGLNFDRYAWGDRHIRPAGAKTGLSFQDAANCQTHIHKLSGERRLPSPDWAFKPEWLKHLLVVFLEQRFNLQPSGTLDERRTKIRQAELACVPKWNETLDKLNREYVEARRKRTHKARLKKLEMEIEALDTQVRMSRNGVAADIVGVVYFYYSVGFDSVGVAEQLKMKPPAVRMILYRLNHTWEKRFNSDGTLKSVNTQLGMPRTFDWEKAAELYRGGMSSIEVAFVVGVKPNFVLHALRKMDVPVRPRGGPRKKKKAGNLSAPASLPCAAD